MPVHVNPIAPRTGNGLQPVSQNCRAAVAATAPLHRPEALDEVIQQVLAIRDHEHASGQPVHVPCMDRSTAAHCVRLSMDGKEPVSEVQIRISAPQGNPITSQRRCRQMDDTYIIRLFPVAVLHLAGGNWDRTLDANTGAPGLDQFYGCNGTHVALAPAGNVMFRQPLLAQVQLAHFVCNLLEACNQSRIGWRIKVFFRARCAVLDQVALGCT